MSGIETHHLDDSVPLSSPSTSYYSTRDIADTRCDNENTVDARRGEVYIHAFIDAFLRMYCKSLTISINSLLLFNCSIVLKFSYAAYLFCVGRKYTVRNLLTNYIFYMIYHITCLKTEDPVIKTDRFLRKAFIKEKR